MKPETLNLPDNVSVLSCVDHGGRYWVAMFNRQMRIFRNPVECRTALRLAAGTSARQTFDGWVADLRAADEIRNAPRFPELVDDNTQVA